MKYPYDGELLVCAENINSEAGEKFLDALDAYEEDPSDENEEKLRLVRISFVEYLIATDSIDAENRGDYLDDQDEGSGILDEELKDVKHIAEDPMDGDDLMDVDD
jgi:hypothetical protein